MVRVSCQNGDGGGSWVGDQNRDRKSMTAGDVTGFYAFFLRPDFGQFSPYFGPVSQLHRKPGEKREKSIGPYPQYGWDFPEEIPEKFRKDPGSVSWNCPREYGWDAPNPF